jgi:hypothetical protein
MTVLDIIFGVIAVIVVIFLVFGFFAIAGPLILAGIVIALIIFALVWFIGWASTTTI